MSEEVSADVNSNGSKVGEESIIRNRNAKCEESSPNENILDNMPDINESTLESKSEKETRTVSNSEKMAFSGTTEDSLLETQRLKQDLKQLKADFKASLDRESELSVKLQKFNLQTVHVAELEILNEELREQLNDSLKSCADLSVELKRVTEAKAALENDVQNSNTDVDKNDALLEQIAQLETKCEEHKQEMISSQEKLHSHDVAAKRAISSLKKELQLRVDQVTKMYEDCLREKDNLATKASQLQEEKQEMMKLQDKVDVRLTDLAKENEKLQQALKSVQSEHKTCQASLTEQENQVKAKQQELDKSKEDINSHLVKVKWAQNKLRTELDAHKDTKAKLVQVTQKLKEAKEEGEQIRTDCQAMIKQYQESEEMKSNSLDQELRLKQSELMKHTKSIATQDENYKTLLNELTRTKERLKILTAENSSLTLKVHGLEEKVAKYAMAISTYEKTLATQRKEIDNQINKIEELDKYRALLHNAEEKNSELITEKSLLADAVKELQSEMAACHAKESELLDSMKKLTGKCTQLQSTLSVVTAQNESLNKENTDFKSKCEKLKMKTEDLSTSLKNGNESWSRKEDEFQRNLEEKTRTVQELATNLEDTKNDLKVLKKRNAAHMKDITRQLQHSKKKVDALEKNVIKERLSSHSSSSGSLDKTDNVIPLQSSSNHQAPMSPTAEYAVNNGATSYNNLDLMSTEVQVKTSSSIKNHHELDREKSIMLDKICMLQKKHAKNNEKMDFLEEHNQALLEEITKKNRIIQHYMMKEDSGQLTSSEYDEKKAKLAKNRGVMSSVYSSKQTDSTMTLGLSLEINKKLQALLEDTILKNMTLKGNIDTLGDEVARLSKILSEQGDR